MNYEVISIKDYFSKYCNLYGVEYIDGKLYLIDNLGYVTEII